MARAGGAAARGRRAGWPTAPGRRFVLAPGVLGVGPGVGPSGRLSVPRPAVDSGARDVGSRAAARLRPIVDGTRGPTGSGMDGSRAPDRDRRWRPARRPSTARTPVRCRDPAVGTAPGGPGDGARLDGSQSEVVDPAAPAAQPLARAVPVALGRGHQPQPQRPAPAEVHPRWSGRAPSSTTSAPSRPPKSPVARRGRRPRANLSRVAGGTGPGSVGNRGAPSGSRRVGGCSRRAGPRPAGRRRRWPPWGGGRPPSTRGRSG